ncbi:MAG: hypothetical protein AB7T06_42800 [Kofleriaceae bacterium]
MGSTQDTPAKPTTVIGWIWDGFKGIGMILGGVVVLGAIVVGVAWWEGWITIGGTRGFGGGGKGLANGEVCKRDRDCVSDFCERRQRRCSAKLRTGDACDLDVECSSDNCELATTRASKKTCR